MDADNRKKLSWFEDPRLDALTPGQRYTGLIVVILAVLMLRFGVPRGGPASALPPGSLPGPGPTTSIVSATLPPASSAAPNTPVGPDLSSPPDTTAVVPAPDVPPTEADTAQTPSPAPTPTPPPPKPPSTTTTTQPCTVPSVPGVPSVLCSVP